MIDVPPSGCVQPRDRLVHSRRCIAIELGIVPARWSSMLNTDAFAALSTIDLGRVTGGQAPPAPGEGGQPAEPAPQQSWGQAAWQGVKDFTGGFVAGATTGRRDDQPWGDSSSRASKAGGETGVMLTGRTGRPRR